jgi:transcription elongation factor Elf1
MVHKHHCPECYVHWSCTDDCTIEPDLEEDGNQFGAHYECPACRSRNSCIKTSPDQTGLTEHTGNKSCIVCNPAIQMEIKIAPINPSKEWWDRYNGFSN